MLPSGQQNWPMYGNGEYICNPEPDVNLRSD